LQTYGTSINYIRRQIVFQTRHNIEGCHLHRIHS
jgi:hypothetical protein